MKITCPQPGQARGTQAMTLAEMMVSMAIFMLLMGGFMSVYIFGMRQDELVNSSLGANDQSRENFNLMMDEIRACKNIQIGSGDYTSFVPLTTGYQQGPSLQIIPSTNLTMFIYYWFDTNNAVLWRAGITNGVATTNIVAQYLTNQTSQWLTNSMTFRAMDYTGTTNLTVDPTNYNYNYVVNVLLQFAQYQYPLTMVGSNYLYDYYQLTYSATRRNP
jgi:hypothetical protein